MNRAVPDFVTGKLTKNVSTSDSATLMRCGRGRQILYFVRVTTNGKKTSRVLSSKTRSKHALNSVRLSNFKKMLYATIAMVHDLSNFHYPVTEIFKSAELSALAPEQIEFYREHGFVSGIKLLDDTLVEALRSALVQLMDPSQHNNPLFYEYNLNESAEPGKSLFHALGAWRVLEVFHDMIFHPVIARVASQLLEGPVRFWHDQVFVKPARDGGVVAWHQDYSYWVRTKPIAHLTCWIALDDANEENGCVHYVPGSHKWDLLPKSDLANKMDAVFELLDDERKRDFKPFANVLKAGEASFHHPMMLHGSYENRSDKPRRATVLNYMRDGVCSDTNDPLLDGVTPITRGERIGGRFFPLLNGAEELQRDGIE